VSTALSASTTDKQMAGARGPAAKPLLRLTDLSKTFPGGRGRSGVGPRELVHAVDGVTLDVAAGETLGVVGESGCGKSTLGRLIVRLLDPTGGRVEFDGQDITALSRRSLRPIRRDLQLIFQDPFASLNPRRRVIDAVTDPLQIHGVATGRSARSAAVELFQTVGLRADAVDRYPHEFSGGQRQRIGIARALATRPRLLVADEPVSALDVSIQAQILNLMAELQEQLSLTYVFITHDLGVVNHFCDRIAVMYLGELVETGPAGPIYSAPAHPYTEALLSAIPQMEGEVRVGERIVLRGDVPSPINKPTGCPFHTRCAYVRDRCRTERPLPQPIGPGRLVSCHYPRTAAEPVAATHPEQLPGD